MAKVIKPSPSSPATTASTAEQPKLSVLDKIKQVFASTPSNWDEFDARYSAKITYPHEELLDEETTIEDPAKALKDIWQKPIPQARKRVTQVIATPEATAPKALDEFMNIISEYPDLNKAFSSLGMVSKLLKNSYIPGQSVIAEMGFDQENLHHIMQAVFSLSSGKFVPEYRIQGVLGLQKPTLAVFYYDLLGLTDSNSRSEIEEKANEFFSKIERLDELLRYPSPGFVTAALTECKKNKDPKKISEIIHKFGFNGAAIRFDEEEIKKILEEAKNKPAAPPVDTPKPKTEPSALDYDTYYGAIESQPLGLFFSRLHATLRAEKADFESHFQNQYFNGDDLATIVDTLNGIFADSGTTDLGEVLLQVSLNDPTSALLQKIAETYKINDPKALNQKLAAISRDISSKYSKLSPKPATAKKAAESPKIDMDYEAIYDQLQEVPALAAAHVPLYHLFYALRRSEDDYNAKDKNQLFEGEKRYEVMDLIDSNLGNGMSTVLQEAAINADPKTEYLTALIKGIAEHFDLTKKPDDLKTKILEIGSELGRLYPKLKIN